MYFFNTCSLYIIQIIRNYTRFLNTKMDLFVNRLSDTMLDGKTFTIIWSEIHIHKFVYCLRKFDVHYGVWVTFFSYEIINPHWFWLEFIFFLPGTNSDNIQISFFFKHIRIFVAFKRHTLICHEM